MGYMNADDVLPKHLIKEIQEYVDGQIIYIPRRNENLLSWGEKSGARDKLAKRNQEIVKQYYLGVSISDLSERYYLSKKRIQGIIHTYESSEREERKGGFTNE